VSAQRVEYIHLASGSELPRVSHTPRRVMVLIEQDVERTWQDDVSSWIVESGCLYMMAWGRDCISWDDSVDHANLEHFHYGEIPDDSFISTTWHTNEPLGQVFFYAHACAYHPTIELPLLTILDIRETPREAAILGLYEAERAGLLDDALTDPRDLSLRERFKILLKLS
jgi:hypothetical protein